MRLSPALLTVALVAALPALHAQPAGPGGRPPPIQPRIKLGGKVAFGRENLELVSPSKPPQACSSPAFTADEVARVAGDRVGDFKVMNTDGTVRSVTRSVKLEARNGKAARWVPLADYVRELNQAETFYNHHGYTLRRGPYALRSVVSRPDRARRLPECISRDSLPMKGLGLPLIRYRLVDTPPGPHGNNGPWLPDPNDVPQTNPNPPGPGDVMGGLTGRVANPVINPADLSLEGKARFGNMLSEGIKMPPVNGIPVLTPMSGSACPTQCTYELGQTAFLTPEAQALVNNPNEVVYTKWGCKIITDSGNNAANCEPIHKFKIKDVTRADVWTSYGVDVPFFIAHHKTPCDVLKRYPQNMGIGEAKDLGVGKFYTLSNASTGNEVVQIGETAKTFYDGSLKYSNKGIADCVLDVGSSNSLFGAEFCLRYDTVDTYAPGKGFQVVNGAGISTGVTLFGQEFKLVDGRAQIDWTQPVPGARVQPNVNSTIPVEAKTLHFEGPQGTFLIGPVPFTVSTFAEAELSAGKPMPTSPVPLQYPTPAMISVGMKAGGQSDVSVHMDAAIDAFILSAGVSGKLSVLKNSVTGGITSNINPQQNELMVEKSYDFTSTALAGTISAFVEIDLIVYTERYDVELLSFPGITKNFPLEKKTWGPIKAVVPSSASTAPSCPK